MNNAYDTLVEALAALREKGFVHDFNLESSQVVCKPLDLCLSPKEFEVVEFHRFEGMSNPSDSSVVYALESSDGVKGVLIDAYGAYAEGLSPDMAAKLSSKN